MLIEIINDERISIKMLNSKLIFSASTMASIFYTNMETISHLANLDNTFPDRERVKTYFKRYS